MPEQLNRIEEKVDAALAILRREFPSEGGGTPDPPLSDYVLIDLGPGGQGYVQAVLDGPDVPDRWTDWDLVFEASFGDLAEGRHVLFALVPRKEQDWPIHVEWGTEHGAIAVVGEGDVRGTAPFKLRNQHVEFQVFCLDGTLTLHAYGDDGSHARIALEGLPKSREGMKGGVFRFGPKLQDVHPKNPNRRPYADTQGILHPGGDLQVHVPVN